MCFLYYDITKALKGYSNYVGFINRAVWDAMIRFSETVIQRKETVERMREDNPLADPLRRRRPGRRRLHHGRYHPP